MATASVIEISTMRFSPALTPIICSPNFGATPSLNDSGIVDPQRDLFGVADFLVAESRQHIDDDVIPLEGRAVLGNELAIIGQQTRFVSSSTSASVKVRVGFRA